MDRWDERDETLTYQVVVNGEGQYSIWPAGRALPDGWSAVGFEGPKADCLTHVGDVWTDLRPKSVRRGASDQS